MNNSSIYPASLSWLAGPNQVPLISVPRLEQPVTSQYSRYFRPCDSPLPLQMPILFPYESTILFSSRKSVAGEIWQSINQNHLHSLLTPHSSPHSVINCRSCIPEETVSILLVSALLLCLPFVSPYCSAKTCPCIRPRLSHPVPCALTWHWPQQVFCLVQKRSLRREAFPYFVRTLSACLSLSLLWKWQCCKNSQYFSLRVSNHWTLLTR